jgi:hypothetical protein
MTREKATGITTSTGLASGFVGSKISLAPRMVAVGNNRIRQERKRLAAEADRLNLSETAQAWRDSKEPTMLTGMFVLHRCWKCNDGERACVTDNPRQCKYPHARND